MALQPFGPEEQAFQNPASTTPLKRPIKLIILCTLIIITTGGIIILCTQLMKQKQQDKKIAIPQQH